MKEEKTEGLLLQTTAYLGQKKILKILTPHKGYISCITQKKSLKGFTDPFLIAEWVYQDKGRDLHSLTDASLLDDLLQIRSSYTALQVAGKIAACILRIAFAGKSEPILYSLSTAYFRKVSLYAHTPSFVASFQLKLLLHEGLLALQDQCSICKQTATSFSFHESYCWRHTTNMQHSFTKEQWSLIQLLMFSKSFQEIQSIQLESRLEEKIDRLFQDAIR